MDFGLPEADMDRIVASGEPFLTSGCAGYDSEVACNRPFANSRPGPYLRNHPFPSTAEDIDLIRLQMGGRVARLNDRNKIVGEMNG